MTLFVWLCKRNFTYCEQKSNLTRAILATLKLPLWICCKIYGFKAQSQPATTRAVRLAPWKRFFFFFVHLSQSGNGHIFSNISSTSDRQVTSRTQDRTSSYSNGRGEVRRQWSNPASSSRRPKLETGNRRNWSRTRRWTMTPQIPDKSSRYQCLFNLSSRWRARSINSATAGPQLWVSPRHPFITLWYYF